MENHPTCISSLTPYLTHSQENHPTYISSLTPYLTHSQENHPTCISSLTLYLTHSQEVLKCVGHSKKCLPRIWPTPRKCWSEWVSKKCLPRTWPTPRKCWSEWVALGSRTDTHRYKSDSMRSLETQPSGTYDSRSSSPGRENRIKSNLSWVDTLMKRHPLMFPFDLEEKWHTNE